MKPISSRDWNSVSSAYRARHQKSRPVGCQPAFVGFVIALIDGHRRQDLHGFQENVFERIVPVVQAADLHIALGGEPIQIRHADAVIAAPS